MNRTSLARMAFIAVTVAIGACGTSDDLQTKKSDDAQAAFDDLCDTLQQARRIEFDIIDEFNRTGPVVINDPDIIRAIRAEIYRLGTIRKNSMPFTNVLGNTGARITIIGENSHKPMHIRLIGLNWIAFPESEEFEGWFEGEDRRLYDLLWEEAQKHADRHPSDRL